MLTLETNGDAQHFLGFHMYIKIHCIMDRYIKSKAQADLEGINKHIERSIDSFFTSLFTLITFRFSLIYDTTLGFF